jgi:branched-chain amino acid transport system permease protein
MRGAAADALVMAAAVLLIALVAGIFGSASLQRMVTHAAIMLTAVAALQIFSGNTRIVSFGHAAFTGIGAYGVGILTMSAALQSVTLRELPAFMAGHELSLAGALGVMALIGLALGAITGIPLLRLTGSSASIATLALLIIVYTVLIAAREVTRGSQPFYGVPRNVDLWVAVPIAIGALMLARVFRETHWGLAARASANDEQGAAAIGVDRRSAFFATWTLSVMVATLAGGLMAQFLGAFTPHGFYFELAFTLLAMLIVGGMGSSFGALAGVVVTTVLIEVVRHFESGGEVFSITVPSIFGLTQATLAIGMILIIWRRPEGLTGGLELRVLQRLRGQRSANSEVLAQPPKRVAHVQDEFIEVTALTKRYAGLTAVENVSIEIPRNSITGVIGPNGAGKSTLINMISGHTRPSSGTIRIGGRRFERAATHIVARAGVARTFQNIRIFAGMTVLENVLVAARQVEPTIAAAERVARRELATAGLLEAADRPASSLAYGSRRQLEIARALALDPRFLLLDEPAAGMNPVETQRLIEMLARVRAERGLGIVLIEHDLKLVMNHCERVIVLDQGRVIASGAPSEVQKNPAVIAAYLGSRTGAKVLPADVAKSAAVPGRSLHA